MSLVAMSPLVLVGRWSTRSQEQARRNAMTACTVLTVRRLERIEVEAFITDRLADRSGATATGPAPRMVGVG
jgi:hypothetical protein